MIIGNIVYEYFMSQNMRYVNGGCIKLYWYNNIRNLNFISGEHHRPDIGRSVKKKKKNGEENVN